MHLYHFLPILETLNTSPGARLASLVMKSTPDTKLMLGGSFGNGVSSVVQAFIKKISNKKGPEVLRITFACLNWFLIVTLRNE